MTNNSRYTRISFYSFKKKHHNVTTHYSVPAQRPQNVYFFTRFQTGVAITPFCTLVTVITSSVAPSAL